MKPYKLDIPAFKKHSSVIYEKFNCMTVLVLERSKEVVRRNLIDNHLMFIEKNKYIYLPYAGIVFNEVDSYGKDDIKELTYKDFIVSTLNNRFRDLHKCAFYLSEGELKESEFRELVQFECYKDSDDEKHPDKL